MRVKKVIIALLLLACLLPRFAASASAANTDDIIRQMLLYYAHHQEAAETDVLRLMEQLRTVDEKQAQTMEKIMASWHRACTELEIHPGVLPDGLPQDDSLCIVVMGFQLYPHGEMMPELLGRMEAALASAEKYPDAYILCSGGGNYHITEADRMAGWLKDQGIAKERIIVEKRSYSTEKNAEYSVAMLAESYPQISTLALVSSDYHMRRCHWFFESAIILAGLEQRFTVAGNAVYEAGYIGESGYQVEAEGMGKLLGLRVRGTAPKLSKLTEIQVKGRQEYTAGETWDISVTAVYDCGFSREVTEKAVLSGVDLSVPGSGKLTVTYEENGITAESSLEVTVLAPPTEVTLPPETKPPQPTQAVLPEPDPEAENTDVFPLIPVLVVTVVIAAVGSAVKILRRSKGKYEKGR